MRLNWQSPHPHVTVGLFAVTIEIAIIVSIIDTKHEIETRSQFSSREAISAQKKPMNLKYKLDSARLEAKSTLHDQMPFEVIMAICPTLSKKADAAKVSLARFQVSRFTPSASEIDNIISSKTTLFVWLWALTRSILGRRSLACTTNAEPLIWGLARRFESNKRATEREKPRLRYHIRGL